MTKIQKTGKRQQPTSSPSDTLFANTAGGTFGDKFDAFVDDILPSYGIAEVANFVRIAGKRSRDNTASHMIRRLPDIACQLELLESSAWDYNEISFVLYGTQSCKESDDGYLRIMMTMSKIAFRTVLKNNAIDSLSLAIMLCGLRSNKIKEQESKEMVSSLSRIVEKCSEPHSAQNAANELYGLQGMSSDDADVRSLMCALSGQVARYTEPLSAQNVGYALYGLQVMSSDDPAVRSLVRALVGPVARCTQPLDLQAVGNSFYGQQRMRSDDADVRSLLNALKHHLWNRNDGPRNRKWYALDAQALGNALYGLQGMSCDGKDWDMRSLLDSLSGQVAACMEPLDAQAVGNALCGLQSMSSDDADVR